MKFAIERETHIEVALVDDQGRVEISRTMRKWPGTIANRRGAEGDHQPAFVRLEPVILDWRADQLAAFSWAIGAEFRGDEESTGPRSKGCLPPFDEATKRTVNL